MTSESDESIGPAHAFWRIGRASTSFILDTFVLTRGANDMVDPLIVAMVSAANVALINQDVALQLRSGTVRVGVDPFDGPGSRRVERWLDRATFALVGAVGLLASAVMLVGAALAPGSSATVTLTAVGYIGLVVSTVMLLRSVAQILRRETDRP